MAPLGHGGHQHRMNAIDRDFSAEPSRTSGRLAFAFLVFALALNLWSVTRGWHESLSDAHEFRQIQTALTAYHFKATGFRLDYETPVLGPPWSIPMEFPSYQAAVAGLSHVTGWPLEQCGRGVSILSFYAGLVALYLVVRQWGLSRVAGWCAVATALTAPLYAFYARTFLIETTALCLGLWFLWGFQHGLAGHRWVGGTVALLAGALAALTKVTTFAVFALPALVAGLAQLRAELRSPRPDAQPAALLAWSAPVALTIALLAGAWVRYSDALKAANPYADFLTSAALRDWNFGSIAQRLDPAFWQGIYSTISANILSEPMMLALCVGLAFASAANRKWILAGLAYGSAGYVLFSNLYFVHDYYHCATAVFLTTALGLALASLIEDVRLPAMGRVVFVAAALLTQSTALARGYGNFHRRPNPPPMPVAAIVRATTAPDDVVVAFGLDWNGHLAYHSQRRAIMVPDRRIDDPAAFESSLGKLGPLRVGAMVVAGVLKNSPHFILPKVELLDLEPVPIAESETMAVYLRRDRHDRALASLQGQQFPDIRLFLERRPPPPAMKEEHSMETAEWTARLAPLFHPQPYRYRSIFPLTVIDFEGRLVLSTHAPTEILLRPPAGARHFAARGGLMPNSHSDGNATDGVSLQVFEELASGARRLLHQRLLRPVETPADRGPVTIEFSAHRAFTGTLVLKVDPGPTGNVNFDWAYWESVRIY